MIQGIKTIREHLNLTDISFEEEAFLTGLICGIRAANMSDSCMTYIENLENHHILWLYTPSLNRLNIKETDQGLTITTTSIYGKAGQKQVAMLDNCSLKFIQSISSTSIAEYITTSHIKIAGFIYERRISFLSLGESSAPRFMICKICVSSHSHPSLPKVMRDGDSYYYRLKHMPSNWIKKTLSSLTIENN